VQAKRKFKLQNNGIESDEDDIVSKNSALKNFYGRNSYGVKIDSDGSKIDTGIPPNKNNDCKSYNLRNGTNSNVANKAEIKQPLSKTIRNYREPEGKFKFFIYCKVGLSV